MRLWNYDGSGTKRSNFRPKDEEDLSDEIFGWLSSDLGPSRHIVVNREVQPRRGQKTDIYINALNFSNGHEESEILTTVIEVKGCWNNELLTAMESQLVNNYLIKNGLRTGIYLVGWYMCDKWNDSDNRKANTLRITIDELRRRLLSQADQLKAKMPDIADIKLYILDLSL